MISKLRLENWKSHKNSEFQFAKGTNVLVGVMGAGKTAVIDAICFALFGTFPALQSKRVSLDEVIMNKPNKMSFARVSLEFDYNGKQYLVERSISRDSKASQAKLLENGRLKAGPKVSDVSNAIEELLELSFELFSRAVYSEQNQIDYFLRLSPSQRKEKFDELLEISKYEIVRGNAVQLCNRLKKSIEEKEKTLASFESSFDRKQVDELLARIASKERENIDLKKKIRESSKQLQELQKKTLELESARKKFNSLREVVSGLSARRKEIEKTILEIEKKLGKPVLEENVVGKEESLKKELEQLKKARKEVEELKARIQVLKEQKQFLEKQVKERSTGLPKTRQELESRIVEFERKLQELKNQEGFFEGQLNALLEKIAGFKSKVEEFSTSKAKLEQAQAVCPVCLQELEEQAKHSLLLGIKVQLEQAVKELELLREKELKLESEKKLLREKINSSLDSMLKLKNLQPVFEEVEKNFLKIQELDSLIKQLLSAVSLQKPVSELEIERVDKEILKIEKMQELVQKKRQLVELESEEIERGRQLKELNFDEKALENAFNLFSDLKAGLSSMKKQFESNAEITLQLQENLQRLNELMNQIDFLKAETSSIKFAVEKIGIFTNVLKESQSQLRQELIKVLNQALHDIWQRVYPYRDFESARLEIQEGNYELKVKELNGSWVRVEGILSGGERSAAAIAIRVAFSLILTQNLSWLILDEPTHNLDSNAVRVLSEMLRSHLPQLVEQVFLITHDSELEKAASAAVFELKREKNANSASIPVQKA